MKHVNLFESKNGNILLLKEFINELVPTFTTTYNKAVVKYEGTNLIGNVYLDRDLDKRNVLSLYGLFQYLDKLNNKINYRIRCRPDSNNGVLIEISMSVAVFDACHNQIKNYVEQSKTQKRFDL